MRSSGRPTVVILVAGLFLIGAGCGSNGGGTGPDPVQAPAFLSGACPDVSQGGAVGGSIKVTYPTPTVTYGTPPVSAVTCAPASGTAFPVGSTRVTCAATDAIARSASCTFNVTVTSAKLSAMTFVAFGDSTTAGDNGNNDSSQGDPPRQLTCGGTLPAAAIRQPQFVNYATSYPTQLQSILSANFPLETFSVDNQGNPGEYAAQADVPPPPPGQPTPAAGDYRLANCVLPSYAQPPDAILILEGINDINFGNIANASNVVAALVSDVMAAKAKGIPHIFVGTILPELPNGGDPQCPGDDNSGCRNNLQNGQISDVNKQIVPSVQAAGAVVVDTNAAFFAADSTLSTLIQGDGLHPSPAGYQVVAKAFYAQIIATIPYASLARRR